MLWVLYSFKLCLLSINLDSTSSQFQGHQTLGAASGGGEERPRESKRRLYLLLYNDT